MRKHDIAVAPSLKGLKSKKGETDKKGGEKNHFIRKLIYFSSVKLLHHMVICLHQRWKWCLKFAGRERSTRRICFYWLSCMLLVWHKLIWEKATTKKRITILMKETKIKTSSLSLTLKPGNKILVRLIIFLLSEKTRTQNKRWAGFNNNFDFDDCSHEHPEFSVPGN